MSDDALLRGVRTRYLLRRVLTGEKARLPCSDMRVAIRLVQRGFLFLRDPKHRDLTTSYELTPAGQDAIEGLSIKP